MFSPARSERSSFLTLRSNGRRPPCLTSPLTTHSFSGLRKGWRGEVRARVSGGSYLAQ